MLVCDCWQVLIRNGVVAAVTDGSWAPTMSIELEPETDGSPSDSVRAAWVKLAPLAEVHSTSWRWDSGVLRLNFVVVSAASGHVSCRTVPPYDTARVGSWGTMEERVVSHAVRHVSFLLRTDPGFLSVDDRDVWLTATAPHVPDVFREMS